jgi:hypothetical protein
MRYWLFATFLLATMSTASFAADINPMTAGDVSCAGYLVIAEGSAEKQNLDSWVAGRVAAIVPAPFQPTLRSIPMERFRKDLRQLCKEVGADADLFVVSALLAYRYQQARE